MNINDAMTYYQSLETEIRLWAQNHSLSVSANWNGRRISNVYVSSTGGECFQIWIEPTSNGKIGVHADYVEGSREPEPSQDSYAEVNGLRGVLEEAFQTVLGRMAPSSRHIPK